MTSSRSTPLSFDGPARPLLAGLLAIQGFLGYEWLMSGLSKVLNASFVPGLGDNLSDASKALTGPYKSFLDAIVIPNAQAFAFLVLLGELGLGVLLIATALVWWFRWHRLSLTGRSILLGLIIAAGVVAILMNVNFHLANGGNHPWLIAADPFDEGVDLDSVMPLVQAAISLVALRLLLDVRQVDVPAKASAAARGVADPRLS